MLVVFLPTFLTDTKTIYGYNFVAPLKNKNRVIKNMLPERLKKIFFVYKKNFIYKEKFYL